jgi:hypothetical protein
METDDHYSTPERLKKKIALYNIYCMMGQASEGQSFR